MKKTDAEERRGAGQDSSGPAPGSVTIAISTASVEAMNEAGQALVIFKAVANSDRATRPLVWSLQQPIAPHMPIAYASSLAAYTATGTDIVPDSVFQPGFTTPIALGQTLQLAQDAGGAGAVMEGIANVVAFENPSETRYNCGLMQAISSVDTPYCVAPLHGAGSIETFTPVDLIVVGFSTTPLQAGQYIDSLVVVSDSAATVTPLLSINLGTSVERAVQYDVDQGWSWDGGIWAQAYPAQTDLVRMLILEQAP
jgi:hypothetical protein